MKKLLLFFTLLGFSLFMFAQVSKTLNLPNAGKLSSTLTVDELNTVTNLTIKGNIDARDFKTMRDEMPVLTEIDMSGATIVEFSGSEQTSFELFYPANEIPSWAFSNFVSDDVFIGKTSLKSVKLPVNLTTVGWNAFRGCSGIDEIAIPSGVKELEDGAFQGCSALAIIDIPFTVSTIGSSAFENCISLITISISGLGNFGENMRGSVPQRAFAGCTGLTSISIPSTIGNINNEAFLNCSSLTSLYLPESVSGIGLKAFTGSNVSITVDPNSIWLYSNDGVLITKYLTTNGVGNSTLIHCPRNKQGQYIIPEGVTKIGDEAFSECSGLTTVILPSTITTIANKSFSNCSGLSSITALNTNPVDLSESSEVFNGINKSECSLFVPASSVSVYSNAGLWKDFNIKRLAPTIENGKSIIETIFPNTLRAFFNNEEFALLKDLQIKGPIKGI